MTKFKLINPLIIGSLDCKYDVSTANEAANKFWNQLTIDHNYVTNNVPQFFFTLMEENNRNLHHFVVKEKPVSNGAKYVDYEINEVNVKLDGDEKSNFIDRIHEMELEITRQEKQQTGGKHRKKRYLDDDSSSSSSSDGYYRSDYLSALRLKNLTNYPISYFLYNPAVYCADINTKIETKVIENPSSTIVSSTTTFVPTFVTPMVPYFQLWFR